MGVVASSRREANGGALIPYYYSGINSWQNNPNSV